LVELWFAILATTFTVFAVLEGWDFGAGALHLVVAKTQAERREVVAAIGPLWSWHEVWLVAAGGTFMVAFPKAMATAFSGYYMALWLVLWSFILRGIALEVGGHLAAPLWQDFWDFVFAVANVLLAVVFGAALGNVIRGVPLDESGRFSLALFTDFTARGHVGILDWYTLSTAVETLLLLGAHGATYLTLKTSGVVHDRSDRAARWLWLAVAVLFPLVTFATWIVRPEMFAGILARPLGWLALALILGATALLVLGRRQKNETRAFAGSCGLIVGLMAALCVGIYPVLLHSTLDASRSLTAHAAASSRFSLGLALFWWPVAFVLSIVYFTFIARQYRGKVRPSQDNQGFY
jgi:cytochrome d ubiquinol oxidase subunit II